MSAGAPAVRAVAGARWSCQGTGFCCRFHQLGPVEPAIVERLRAEDPGAWWPPAAAGWLSTTPVEGGPVHELRKVDGHCVFLDGQNRCVVHARLGAEAKPGFCRLFPFQLVEDPDGVAVVVRDSCAGRNQGQAQGRDVAQAGAELLGQARAGGAVLRWQPERVELAPDQAVDRGTWMAIERGLLSWLETASGTPAALVAGLRQRLADATGLRLPAPDPARARLAARAVVMALDLTLARVQAQEAAPSEAEAAFVAALHERVRRAGASLEAGLDPLLSPEVREDARQILASALLGKEVHRQDGVLAGLGRYLVGIEIAARGAPTSGAAAVDVAAFSAEHARIVRFTQNRSIRHVLARARPALLDLALHVPG